MILVGPDHPIQDKISCAKGLFEAHGKDLLSHREIKTLLGRYAKAIEETWAVMRDTGVVDVCTQCAIEDGGSCCGNGIEDKFDVALLLINLLLGEHLPEAPWDDSGCWFLGPKGCTIKARHTICVNYLCKRLTETLPRENIHKLQAAIVAETDLGFLLEERIKGYLKRCSIQKTSP